MQRSKLSKKVLLDFGREEGEGEGVLNSPYTIYRRMILDSEITTSQTQNQTLNFKH